MSSPWTCLSCYKSFVRKGDLTRHKLLHAGFKPHVCSDCGKAFSQLSGLKTHKNVHTKVKPFTCGIDGCISSFGDPSSCARHRKETHRRTGAYKCPHLHCTSRIKRRSAFMAHLRKHKIDPATLDIDALATLSRVPSGPHLGDESSLGSPSQLPSPIYTDILNHLYANSFNRPGIPYAHDVSHSNTSSDAPSEFMGNALSPYINDIYTPSYHTQRNMKMQDIANSPLFTMDTSSLLDTPPSLTFSLSPSPTPSTPEDRPYIPNFVHDSPIQNCYDRAKIVSSSLTLRRPSLLLLGPECPWSYKDYSLKQGQWDFEGSLFDDMNTSS